MSTQASSAMGDGGAEDAIVEATFPDNGSPAVVVASVGSGRRMHFASFLAQGCFQTGLGAGANQRPATDGWSAVMRAY